MSVQQALRAQAYGVTFAIASWRAPHLFLCEPKEALTISRVAASSPNATR
jgi:hypothetical protein